MGKRATVAEAAHRVRSGGLVAYPTEAVYGLGCDPTSEAAVRKLLLLKQRPETKGLILIAASYSQLLPYIDDDALTEQQRQAVLARWPGPTTWVMPARDTVPAWLRGQFDTLAVRVTAHPIAADLCRAIGSPLVSTSANLTGEPPARSDSEVLSTLGEHLDAVVAGPLGGRDNPSQIIDARTGAVLRA